MKTLILIANSEWALLIHLEGNKFEVIEEREHPESKQKIEHLVSDRPGRTFSRVSAVRHSLNEGQDVSEVERQKFARELINLCKEQYRVHPFQQLWIVAGPKFLGELRSFLRSTSNLPYSILEIHKEISPCEPLEKKMAKIQEWVDGNAVRKRSSCDLKKGPALI